MGSEQAGSAAQEESLYRAGQLIASKYRLDRELGSGAMGTVWSAQHVTLGQRVAIKLITAEYAHSREVRARFDNEAKAAASLRSRFVVQIYDNGETSDGTPFIVMEQLEGETLEERLHRTGPISLQETVRIVSQVARALERAHALSIVHRDLKPANIFLARSPDEDEPVVKVLDFGVAKFTNDETSTTRTGSVIGTPQFMSPEQVRGLKTVDARSDLYALGMIAYTLLTGRVAFSGEAFGDLLLAICTQPLPSIHQENPTLPPSLDGWFQRACAREQDMRFATAGDLVDMLVVAAGFGRSAADIPELTGLGGSTIRNPASNAGVPAPQVMFTPPTYDTVDTGTSVAGVPSRSSNFIILAMLAGVLLFIGLGGAIAAVALFRSRAAEELHTEPAGAAVGPAPVARPPVPAEAPRAAVLAPPQPAPGAVGSAVSPKQGQPAAQPTTGTRDPKKAIDEARLKAEEARKKAVNLPQALGKEPAISATPKKPKPADPDVGF